MSDGLRPIGEFLAEREPNVLGKKPVIRGRKKKPRYVSKADVREVVLDVVTRNSQLLQHWLGEIYQDHGAKEAFYALTSILEYSLPKLQRREVTGADEGPVEIKISWGNDEG